MLTEKQQRRGERYEQPQDSGVYNVIEMGTGAGIGLVSMRGGL